ncbi:hypothetical protein B0H12DRAFT_480971 [Mycena haematopus]|nr:hypothetical protein B0H12DRAFT_480971 [Mycena haematopus]
MATGYPIDEDPPLSFVRSTAEAEPRYSKRLRHRDASHLAPPSASSQSTVTVSAKKTSGKSIFKEEEEDDTSLQPSSQSNDSAHPTIPRRRHPPRSTRISSLSSLTPNDQHTSRPSKKRRIESKPKILNTSLPGHKHMYAFGVPLRRSSARTVCASSVSLTSSARQRRPKPAAGQTRYPELSSPTSSLTRPSRWTSNYLWNWR